MIDFPEFLRLYGYYGIYTDIHRDTNVSYGVILRASKGIPITRKAAKPISDWTKRHVPGGVPQSALLAGLELREDMRRTGTDG